MQSGIGQTLRLLQAGEHHQAIIRQADGANLADITQTGSDHRIELNQLGIGNQLHSVQEGGIGNQILLTQGGGLTLDVLQQGSLNMLSGTQTNASVQSVQQIGNGWTMRIDQFGM